ncbi:MAG: hypothetical protein HQK83_10280 [Fibrobacteria bacterium]|nr:hypothetical protein [Fibrobacteria bacterium]
MQISRLRPVFWLVTAVLVSFSFGEVTFPSGGLTNTSFTDLKDHPQNSKTYNEFWTYHFDLSQNIQIVLNFSRANLGRLKDPVCGTDMAVIGFKGKNYTVAREYPEKNFQFSNAIEGLNVHKNIWFKGALPKAHQVYFNTKKNGVSYYVNLKFSEISQGKTWGDGVFKLGNEKVGIFIHIPRARVQGVVAINNDTLVVEGTCYMDHTFQSDMGTKLVKYGYRYQAVGDNIHVGYILETLKQYQKKIIGFGLTGTPGSLSLLKPENVYLSSSHKPRGVRMPKKMTIKYDSRSVVFTRDKDRSSWSILSEFRGIVKWTAKKFMGGEIIYFRGQGKADGLKANYNFFGLNE